jgi:hypothetical protein
MVEGSKALLRLARSGEKPVMFPTVLALTGATQRDGAPKETNLGNARRGYRFGKAASWILIAILTSHAAEAAVICQKDRLVKFRAVACKPGWTQLANVGGAPDPSGIWEVAGGTLFDVTGLEARFLVLERSGAGRLNLSGGDGGVLTCGSFNYARGETPTLTMDLESIGYLGTRVMRYSLESTDELGLVGADGRTAELTRADAVAPDAECGTLPEVTLFAGLPVPEFFGGLAFDGAQLWYEVQNVGEIVPVDPGTGAAGPRREFGANQFTHVHASAGADFWTHCGCGGSEEAGLVTAANRLVDEVETGEELGEDINVRGIAFDPASGRLWLHGTNAENQGRLLRVDPSGEPDVLVEAFDLDASFSGLAFDGTSLWGLNRSGQSLARIDPTTGRATGNFKIPNFFAEWRGVAVVGTELVLLGDTGVEGALLKLQLPAP